jgi:predicted Zn finger-like uncharacterized protein
MTSLITRCPKCATAFNVTEAHLNTANGAVRCGSCLNVFNGRENLVTSKARIADDDDDILIGDDLGLDDDDQEVKPDPALERVTKILKKTEDAQTDPTSDEDESWALKLLEEEGHNPSQLGLDDQPKVPSQSASEKPAAEVLVTEARPAESLSKKSPKPEVPLSETPRPEASYKESIFSRTKPKSLPIKRAPSPISKNASIRPTNSAIYAKFSPSSSSEVDGTIKAGAGSTRHPLTPGAADAAHEPAPQSPASQKAKEYVATKAKVPEPTIEIAEQDFAELQKEIDAAKGLNPLAIQPAPRALIDAIEVEAVELQYSGKRRALLNRLIWIALSLLAALALLSQVAFSKFDQLSLVEPYRSYYGFACRVLGCTLPIRRNISQVHATNLSVRAHPNTEGALLVDVVIQNNAPFEQPFPKLVLVFSNIKNRVVASRVFAPDEYLGGDLTGATLMPVSKAIHLSLELVDPGKGAVSYKIVVNE